MPTSPKPESGREGFFGALAKNILFLAVLLVFSGWLINTYMEVKAGPETFREPEAVPTVDAMVVPGASVYRSGKLSTVLLERMNAALVLAKGRPGVKMVLSGHVVPNGYNETKAMKDYAVAKGFPARDILIDDRGRSTFVTLLNCKKMFGLKRIVLISQGYHLPRALYISRRLGLQGYGFVVETEQDGEWHGREWFSRFKDFILVRIFHYFSAT